MTTLPKTHLPDGQPPRSGLTPSGQRPYLIGTPKNRTPLLNKAGLVFLPHETEDTRLTGGTRSLIRRLMALNIKGSLGRGKIPESTPSLTVSAPRIA